MGKSLITRLEWPMVVPISEHAQGNKGVRQAFCQCLDSILESIIKEAMIRSDTGSDDRVLKESDAIYACNKF